MEDILVEACVTSLDEAVAAARAGAHRLELCVDLEVGGLTPPGSLLRAVLRAVDIPVFAMARTRAGAFVFDEVETARTVEEILALREGGAHGVVVGAATQEGAVDVKTMGLLVDAASELPVTFHRAFDEVEDPLPALDVLAELGVARVLTSGAAATAQAGAMRLAQLVRAGGHRITIVAGGGVRGDHVQELVEATGVSEVHARAAGIPGIVAALRES